MADNTEGIRVRFESSERQESLEFGPFPFAQLTYDVLRIGDDGDTIAERDEDGYWCGPFGFKDHGEQQWSDVIIWAA